MSTFRSIDTLFFWCQAWGNDFKRPGSTWVGNSGWHTGHDKWSFVYSVSCPGSNKFWQDGLHHWVMRGVELMSFRGISKGFQSSMRAALRTRTLQCGFRNDRDPLCSLKAPWEQWRVLCFVIFPSCFFQATQWYSSVEGREPSVKRILS